jgi:hypothetical protein
LWDPETLLAVRTEYAVAALTKAVSFLRCPLSNTCIELEIARAYMHLAFASQRADGARVISLGRFGSHEVLLVEFRHGDSTNDAELWIELYDNKAQQGLDSCSCTDIGEAAIAARELILRARELNTGAEPDR